MTSADSLSSANYGPEEAYAALAAVAGVNEQEVGEAIKASYTAVSKNIGPALLMTIINVLVQLLGGLFFGLLTLASYYVPHKVSVDYIETMNKWEQVVAAFGDHVVRLGDVATIVDSGEHVDVRTVSEDLDVFTSIIDDPTGISEPYAEALLRAESAGWRSEPTVGQRLLSTITASIAEETARVRVLSEGTITFSGDTGKVPVTITNELDRSVTVGLVLRGQPALRLSSEPLTGIRIEPGKFASVDIEARVVGGDPLNVEVQLLGPEGDDYGRPAPITVASTAYARAAAWVVAAAFIAIVVFVVFGVTRRIRKAHAARGTSSLRR